jgi:hypothetical protein
MTTDFSSSGGVSPEVRIKILLSEYMTLRAEILMRAGHSFVVSILGAAACVWLLLSLFQARSLMTWLALLAIALILGITSWLTMRDISKAAMRIREIERLVNEKAGEELLVWESKWGLEAVGYWATAKPLDSYRERPEYSTSGGTTLWGWIALLVGGVFALSSASYALTIVYAWLKSSIRWSATSLLIGQSFAAQSAPIYNPGTVPTGMILLAGCTIFLCLVFFFCAAVVLRTGTKPADKSRAWDMIKILCGFVVGVSTNMINAL